MDNENINVFKGIESAVKSLDTMKPDLAQYMLDSMKHGTGQRHYICLEDALAAVDNASKAYKRHISGLIHELSECAIQTDCPVYEGDKEVDMYIRLSDVIRLINKYTTLQAERRTCDGRQEMEI